MPNNVQPLRRSGVAGPENNYSSVMLPSSVASQYKTFIIIACES